MNPLPVTHDRIDLSGLPEPVYPIKITDVKQKAQSNLSALIAFDTSKLPSDRSISLSELRNAISRGSDNPSGIEAVPEGEKDTIDATALDAIAGAIDWVTAELRHARAAVVAWFVKVLADKTWGVMAFIVTLLVSVALSVIWNIVKDMAWVVTAMKFISDVGNIVGNILSFMKIDTLIMLVRLGSAVMPKWYESLSKIYDSFGSLAAEMDRDFSYLTTYAEINRSLLYTSYTLSGNSWLKAQAKYAEGIAVFLEGVDAKLESYIAEPSTVFADIQHAISESSTDESDYQSARIWSAVDKANDWILAEGESLITGIHDLESKIETFDSDIQDAIAFWYIPLKEEIDKFINTTWRDYKDYSDKINKILLDSAKAHGIDIQKLKDDINSPIEWWHNLTLFSEEDRSAYADQLNVFFAGVFNKHMAEAKDMLYPIIDHVTDVESFATIESVPGSGDMVVIPIILKVRDGTVIDIVSPFILSEGQADQIISGLPPAWQVGE